jgi:hypothetical protein
MATTTNYSWTTPDDTALVKDGAAAIRTLGSSADTTVKALNPGTTAGDIDYYTAATTKARIAIGTAGQVLQVNSGASAPEWATPSSGGMTLLSTTSLSGATVTISSISGAYNNLFAVIYGVTNATGNGDFRIAPNGSTNGSLYRINGWDNTNGDYTIGEQSTYYKLSGRTFTRTDANNVFCVTFANYANTSHYKAITHYGRYLTGAVGFVFEATGAYNANTAISSLVFSNSGGDLSTGTVLLYGVK